MTNIGPRQAREVARRAIREMRMRADSPADPWHSAAPGEGLLVRTVEGDPSFWLVPVTTGDWVLGSVEVGLDGSQRGVSIFCSSLDRLDECPTVVTRISAGEALQLAAPLLERHPGTEASAPVYVHDTVRGRLAWMIELRRQGRVHGRVFATPGYAWEWRPGEPPPGPGLRGAAGPAPLPPGEDEEHLRGPPPAAMAGRPRLCTGAPVDRGVANVPA